jgi:methionyl-tRNA formyltransferase
MVISKNILFLCGYDYSSSFEGINDIEFKVLIPNNEIMLAREQINNLVSVLGHKAILVNYEDVESEVSRINPNILISFGWRRKIPSLVLLGRKDNINIHPALLPQYKGYHPVPHVLLNNEVEHGITAHIITGDIDSGAIVCKDSFTINKFSTLKSLQNEVNCRMPVFLRQVLNILSKESGYQLIPNDDCNTIVVAAKRSPSDSELHPSDTLSDSFDKIRACDSDRFPAFFVVNGERVYVKLYRSKDAERENEFDL